MSKKTITVRAGVCANCGNKEIIYDHTPKFYNNTMNFYGRCFKCQCEIIDSYDFTFIETTIIVDDKREATHMATETITVNVNDNE